MTKPEKNLKKLNELRLKNISIQKKIITHLNKQVVSHIEIRSLKNDSLAINHAIADLERDVLEDLIA